MDKGDEIFWKEFGAILAFLVLFALGMFFLARAIGASTLERMQNAPRTLALRIAPVGQVRVGDPAQQTEADATQVAMAAAASAGDASAAEQEPGEAVYNGLCTACHATGVAGAPKLGDNEAWSERFAAGMDALLTNSIDGKGAMPPKGGNPALTDEEIRQAVEYMLEKAGVGG